MDNFNVKTPYSYFGNKARVANVIWKGLGDLSNYIEPFCGSLSILLSSPRIAKIETVNDINCALTNFWRAVSNNPNEVAKYADYPVNEVDLHARQRWLSEALSVPEFKKKMEEDLDFYDTKMAGYWIWGMGASIGDNWLKTKGLKALPLLSSAGGGIHGLKNNIYDWFNKLQTRTRRVRICCGDWSRVATPSVTYKNKGLYEKDITGVVLDPPYDLSNRDKVYLDDDKNIYKEVCEWALENADNKRMRIVVCGYDGDFKFPDTWKSYAWTANGGLANLGNDRGKDNSKREMIYFSPYCLNF